jgi:hypothetical protein
MLHVLYSMGQCSITYNQSQAEIISCRLECRVLIQFYFFTSHFTAGIALHNWYELMFSFCLYSNKYLTVTTVQMQSH